MAEPQSPSPQLDPAQLAANFARIAEQSHRIMSEFASRNATEVQATGTDPLGVGRAFIDLTGQMLANPVRLAEAQAALWQEYLKVWHTAARRMMGETTPPVAQPQKGDGRFRDAAWEENFLFDYIKQSYLVTARWIQSTVHDSGEGLDDKTRRKVEFYTRQFVDAMAPSNFVMTNPAVLRTTLESGGENLVKGLNNLLRDLEAGKGQLKISQTDTTAFQVGRNIAVTPGKVVYQNELMQLVQYAPTTEQVHKRPLLIIPPWINKFYILDLRPQNSFIKWATDQGHTVFVISWVNPDERLAARDFVDYMQQGPLAALDAVEQATGEREANVIGYCLGGTLLASTLAWMADKGDDRVKSATYFAAMVDFAQPGELEVFIDEDQLRALEDKMNERGYLEGSEMATTFNMLRANDLIWSFVVNNYLLGKDPFPFDLLYWNSDSTRMPAAMHSFYLRNMYQKNALSKPGGVTLDGVAIDLGTVKTPTFLLASREDHIAPWQAVYRGTQVYGGPVKFVLAASGHIAGVINAPAANKYSHWTNAKNPADAEEWFKGATEHPGSWWPEWQKWIARHAGAKIPARKPGDGALKVLEDAPGSYVQVKSG
ncbi:MAG: PHA/PHB synthase family protein [Alphaproteobacteria bacterium]